MMNMIEDKHFCTEVLKTTTEAMNYGLIYVGEDEMIREYSPLAMKMMGITVQEGESHPAGKLNSGDIVVVLDNDLGNDDKMSPDDLKKINIDSGEIKEGSVVLAIGVYDNKKIDPVYKVFNDYMPDRRVELRQRYLGFSIEAVIDFDEGRMSVKVNGKEYYMDYLESIGYLLAIEGDTGNVKFFQAKGYSYRKEAAGELLRGGSFAGKSATGQISGADYEEIKSARKMLKGKEFYETFKEVLAAENGACAEGVYEIYKRMMYCHLVRVRQISPYDGVYVFLRDSDAEESHVRQVNPLTMEVEKRAMKKRLQNRALEQPDFEGFIGSSPAMAQVKQLALKASKTKFNVIITGESGTGKSLLARQIHNLNNPDAPFVEVVCNAIAPSLIESELFGYAPRAFTGADPNGKMGFFERANGGTIFLDEIGEVPPEIQVKLLHVLQTKRIYRVGSTTPIDVDVRVITATNCDIEEEVKNGNFRQDLYYRINVFPIRIPPLRERQRDLYVLANNILEELCNKYDMEKKQFSEEAIDVITGYDWPGNVRELENIVERAITVCDGHVIYSENLMINSRDKMSLTLKQRVEKEEKKIIEDTLFKNNDDRKKTMEELGLSRTVFYEKLKKYEITG